MSIAALIADMVRAGVDPDIIGRTAELLSAREPVVIKDEQAERRRAADRERKAFRGIPRSSADPLPAGSLSPEPPITPNPIPSKNPPKGGQKGSRLPSGWQPSDADRSAATAEGMPEREIDREAAKFRDFWAAKAGKDGVKADWPATWRNWVRRACETRGWAPEAPASAEPRAGPTSIHINPVDDPEPWRAWCKHKGKPLPIDKQGGWHVPSKYPPEARA